MLSLNDVEKTLIHISHFHLLKLVASPVPRPICHACNMPCADQSYGCIPCHYFLHNTCATTARSMNHPSHPSHTLKLELTPAYLRGNYRCDACGVDGSSFCLRCQECSYDLHLPCAALPHQVDHSSHHHPLTLVYKNPYPPDIELYCDLCKKYLDVNRWFYLCSTCNFGGHVQCLLPEALEVLSPGLQALPSEPHVAGLQALPPEQYVAAGLQALPPQEPHVAAGLQELPPEPHAAALELVNKAYADMAEIHSLRTSAEIHSQAMQFISQLFRTSY